MNNNHYEVRSQWRSETTYLLVTTGAIVGLGNFFQFPLLVAKFGGLFVLFYFLCEIGISIPLLFAELLIGRRGKQNPVGSIGILSVETGANYYWRLLGWLAVFIAFLSWGYYSSAAAFPISFFYTSFTALFADNNIQIADITQSHQLITSFIGVEICFLLFLLATLFVVARGINKGLEQISSIVVPTYFLIVLGLAIYNCLFVDFLPALRAFFDFQSHQDIMAALFAALGFAFFKLNVGMGSMIVYGSYLPYSVSFGRSTLLIVCFDAIICILAYLSIYPLMLNANVPLSGNQLINHDVLLSLIATPQGLIISILFFFGAMIAAWMPTIAMAETVVVTMVERFNLQRRRAVLYLTIVVSIVGTFAVLTHTRWETMTYLHAFALHGMTYDMISEILTLISAFFIAIFAGWIIPKRITSTELGFASFIYMIWLFLVRFIAPITIGLIGITNLF